jgi:hypothetical protein
MASIMAVPRRGPTMKPKLKGFDGVEERRFRRSAGVMG